jgi:hypothetical protein
MTDDWWNGKYLEDGLRKRIETLVRIMKVLAEILTENLYNTSQASRTAHMTRPKITWKEWIKMDFIKIRVKDVIFIEMTEQDSMNTTMNL